MKRRIFVFGIGHLGKFFLNLAQSNYEITGTSRRSKVSLIPFSIGDQLPEEAFREYSYFILMFPPKEGVVKFLMELDDVIGKEIPWIFISSISALYKQGIPSEAEKFLKQSSRKTLILRLGGLVDDQRHPKNFFKNKNLLKGCDSPINLVHTEDVARCIIHCLDYDIIGEFNITSTDHPSKREFYGQYLSDSVVMDPIGSHSRIINNRAIVESGFVFKYPCITEYFKES